MSKHLTLSSLITIKTWLDTKLKTDNQPIKDSSKLITSGAVYEAINKALSNIENGDEQTY